MSPLVWFLLGVITGAVLLLVSGAIYSRNSTGPDPERRRTKGCRRVRFLTAKRIDETAEHFRKAALTYPQAVARLRDSKVSIATIRRVLKTPAITY